MGYKINLCHNTGHGLTHIIMKGISAAYNMPGWVTSNTFTPGYKVQDGAHAMYSCQDGILWAHAMYLCQDGTRAMYSHQNRAQAMYLCQDGHMQCTYARMGYRKCPHARMGHMQSTYARMGHRRCTYARIFFSMLSQTCGTFSPMFFCSKVTRSKSFSSSAIPWVHMYFLMH